jgi:hypothetical protein
VKVKGDEAGKGSQQGGWANWLQLVADTLRVPVGERRDEPFNVDGVSVWLKGETMSADEARQRGKEFSQTETEAVKWLYEPDSIPSLEAPKLDLPDLKPSVLRLSVTDLIEKDGQAKPKATVGEQTLLPQEAGFDCPLLPSAPNHFPDGRANQMDCADRRCGCQCRPCKGERFEKVRGKRSQIVSVAASPESI